MARIIFFGTPEYVIPVLEVLQKAGHEIVAVVTQPPKPVGREQKVTPSSVAAWAQKHGISVITDLTPLRKGVTQGEMGILASYGRILPTETLKVFPQGILNVHPSLLPHWRGASPVAAAIATGEKQTGVTIMKLDEEVDHGPILSQFTEDIKPDDTRGSLRERLFRMGADVLVEILPAYLENRIEPREQEHEKATYTTLIKKDHGFIPPEFIDLASQGETLRTQWEIPFVKDFTIHPSPATLHNFIRALDPWPGAWTEVVITTNNIQQARRLKILKAHIHPSPITHHPSLILELVQLEGKNPVSWEQFKTGYPEAAFDAAEAKFT